jgi:serine/threonine protein kinase
VSARTPAHNESLYRSLGTPEEALWPGVSKLPDFKDHFPKWPRKSAAKAFPKFTGHALDLLMKMMDYDPAKRISCKDALKHPYFDALDKNAFTPVEE